MRETQYNNIMKELDEAYMDRLHLSLQDIKDKNTHSFKNVKELMKEIKHQKSE